MKIQSWGLSSWERENPKNIKGEEDREPREAVINKCSSIPEEKVPGATKIEN